MRQIKLYVRPCTEVAPTQQSARPLSVGWMPHSNQMILLRRTFAERVVYLSEEEVASAACSGVVELPGPLDLCWSILHACNLHCPYCLDGGKGLAVPPREEQGRHLRHMLSSHILTTIDICGGEPLLHRRLYDLLEAIRGADIGITMTTHGGFLAQHAERLSQYLDGIRVSIDGSTAERHDRLRGQPGIFERMLRGVRAAKQRGMRLIVNTVAMQPNSDDWEDIIKLARDEGATEIWLLQFLPLGPGSALANTYAIDRQRFLAIGKELQARYTTPNFTVRLRDNASAAGYVVTYANGNVFANADLDPQSANQRQILLGSLTEKPLDQLWQAHFPRQTHCIESPFSPGPQLSAESFS